jgi:hypothetical protein
MTTSIAIRSSLLTLVIGLTAHAYATEHKIPCSTLPAAIQQKSKATSESRV